MTAVKGHFSDGNIVIFSSILLNRLWVQFDGSNKYTKLVIKNKIKTNVYRGL